MRRSLALASLLLVACPRETAPDAGLPPTKLVFDGVEHTEWTQDFRLGEQLPPSAPLTDAQQALVALTKERFFALADAEHLPRSCDDPRSPDEAIADNSGLMARALSLSPGRLQVTFVLNTTSSEWTGEGCCAPCKTPCVPGSCGYCSPADTCQHFVTMRTLIVSFDVDETGRVRSEHLVRQTSERKLVPAEVITPAPLPGRARLDLGAVEVGNEALVDRQKLNAYLRARQAAVMSCYQRELRRNPSLAGTVKVRFAISPAGRAIDLELEETLAGGAAVGSCVKTVVRGWVFPFKPEEAVQVAIPFLFTSVPL